MEQTRGNFDAYQAAHIPFARTHDASFCADFHKWAVVCEHIICHYNEGWANGYHLGIRYWEIWNEPDGVKENGDQPNGSGTADDTGFTETELHLNEYNYIENWTDRYIASIHSIIGAHGAAYTAACMTVGQSSPLDLMMYYDARPSVFNGLFDYYSLAPLNGYYPFVMFSQLAELGDEVESVSDDPTVYVTAATNGNSCAAIVKYYVEDPTCTEPKNVEIRGCTDEWQVSLLDSTHRMERITPARTEGGVRLTLMPDSVLFLSKK